MRKVGRPRGQQTPSRPSQPPTPRWLPTIAARSQHLDGIGSKGQPRLVFFCSPYVQGRVREVHHHASAHADGHHADTHHKAAILGT